MCRPVRRDGQLERVRGHGLSGQRGGGDGNERIEKHHTLVVVGSKRRCIRRVVGLGVTGPMCVDRPTAVVLGGVVIRMRVYERSAQGRSLDGQGERQSDYLPHVASLFVTRVTTSRPPTPET